VAEKMKQKYGDQLDLEIHLNTSDAARGYVLRGSTTVLVDERFVPLDVATSRVRMDEYLAREMAS
jgi:hypothetical protein